MPLVILPIKSSWIERIRKGYPWVYTQAIASSKLTAQPGDLVYLGDKKNKPFAIGYYNSQTKLACRVLTLDWKAKIDVNFFYHLFSKALTARNAKFAVPYYRLIHAEGDNLPGLIIDRFGDTLVCQTNTAGIEKLKPIWFEALQKLLQPTRVIFRDDTPNRLKEGLPAEISAPLGELCTYVSIIENGNTFYAAPLDGQKTGWFYDQRANRHWVAQYCKNKTVLDLYTYSGGFGISAAIAGASAVKLVDSSQKALDLAMLAATTNQVLPVCEFDKQNVFTLLPLLQEQEKQFDVVIADPPAFVKQAQHKGSGLRGYQKLAKLCATIVAPKGMLFIASCSHHASSLDFRNAVEIGIAKAGREAKLVRKGGADKDHPIHPLLPENHYLKALLYQLD
jgi:23S rRNA (cytosine1962-C5)-methyltransferase